MGQRMKKREFEEMIKSASVKENGLIHIQGKREFDRFSSIINWLIFQTSAPSCYMEKRKRAPAEDGKGKIKKIQAAKEALGADHSAKDKIPKVHSLLITCYERNNRKN